MGNTREAGIAAPQLFTCDHHFMPSFWGTAASIASKMERPKI